MKPWKARGAGGIPEISRLRSVQVRDEVLKTKTSLKSPEKYHGGTGVALNFYGEDRMRLLPRQRFKFTKYVDTTPSLHKALSKYKE